MDAMTDRVRQVRSFNRRVTQRVGALQEEYLSRRRSLGASSVLWEIEPAGTDVRTVRARLRVDSGYLSRLLRALEAEGLVRVRSSAEDQRVRVVRLTAAGRAERSELDRLSDELAGSLLESLDEPHRDRLVEAMTTVERLLTVGLVAVTEEDPTSVDAQHCFAAYFHELDERFEGGFDVGRSIPADATDLVEPAGLMLVARLDGHPVGAGAVKFHGTEPAELKRMWVAGQARGLGIGRRILTELERRARDHDATTARLETNRALTEAIALYRSTGYVEVPPFNDEPYAHHWFEKDLRA
jgi:DNA-binding MarR family transcriptional regulator/ribosomal protein S18 acetylase RimI-like enzyme